MEITYNNQTINFFDFTEMPKQILMFLSGGLDSASLLYLIAKHYPDLDVIPVCARDVNAPVNVAAAEKVLQFVRNEFPNTQIRDLVIYDYDDRDESFYPECRKAIAERADFAHLDECQVSKILQIDQIADDLVKRFPQAMRVAAMTTNPPISVMKERHFYEKAERVRDPIKEGHSQMPETVYKPFNNVDKKFVADIYRQHNLMDNLFPLTTSCVGREDATDNYTKECHRCFWCHEKKWAFDISWEPTPRFIIDDTDKSKIDTVLRKRKHVLDYHSDMALNSELIDELLWRTWKVTPSKNNFMPYSVYVLGPKQHAEKEAVYDICLNRDKHRSKPSIKLKDEDRNPNYRHITSCSHLLIFTMRLEDQPNPLQKQNIAKGAFYKAVSEKEISDLIDTASLEVGFFANTLSALGLDYGIDASFTLCFKRDPKHWDQLPFIKRDVLLVMSLGKAKLYRQDIAVSEGWYRDDYKPDYERIVNFVMDSPSHS